MVAMGAEERAAAGEGARGGAGERDGPWRGRGARLPARELGREGVSCVRVCCLWREGVSSVRACCLWREGLRCVRACCELLLVLFTAACVLNVRSLVLLLWYCNLPHDFVGVVQWASVGSLRAPRAEEIDDGTETTAGPRAWTC